MKKAFNRIISFVLVLSLAVSSALALDGAEAAKRFRQAARAINREGLIAETEPITDEEILEACELLEDSPDRLYEIVNSFLSRMDTHSGYYAPVSYDDSYATLTGYAGVGVIMRQTSTGYVVEEVTPHSPAAEAGIQVGDRLKSVDGISADRLDFDELTDLLRGDAGTKVTLTILRDGEPLKFVLTRAVIHASEIDSEELSAGVFYISISGFTSAYTPADFAAALDALEPGDDLILDLRGNGGGVIDCALTIAEMLLEERTTMCTMRTREDQGGSVTITSKGGGIALDDLVVLVNDRTASAAELLAGILSTAGDAVLIGKTTYGKGQGQYHMTMSSGDILVITMLEMELEGIGCWEGVGLKPDTAVELVKMADAVKNWTPLYTDTALRYGERSENVYAMTERLVLLGYLAEPTDTFTTPVLSALRAFQADAGLDTTIDAHPVTLQKLAEMMQRAIKGDYYTDSQLTAAMIAVQN